LGLFICRKIVELYQGRIWVESELQKGSTFYINLPRLTTQRAEELLHEEATDAVQTEGALPQVVMTPQVAAPVTAAASPLPPTTPVPAAAAPIATPTA
jgi:hypothetical protein